MPRFTRALATFHSLTRSHVRGAAPVPCPLPQNSNFHEIGDNIIAQLGETTGAGAVAWGMGPDGTAGNQPSGTIVKSNFAYRCGLFEKQSSFYFQAKSRENIIRNNIFFHGPRAGMNFNDGL